MKKLYTIDESITANGGPLPLSRSGVYQAIRNGAIPDKYVYRIGHRVFLKGSYFEQIA